jgi:SAM-dependent methyltransferase
MRKGWLIIPGVQDGDRTLEEQTMALRPAIAECAGKTILDLGCAEGLIGREFAKAGALKVTGIDGSAGHLSVAAEQCRKWKNMEFKWVDLNRDAKQLVFSADIVLCLGIAHKLHEPGDCVRLAADSSNDLVLIRSGRGANAQGIIKSKHRETTCDSHAIMEGRGFVLEKVVDGPAERLEPVEYWRRVEKRTA